MTVIDLAIERPLRRALPPKWDGRVVVWSAFEPAPLVFICDRSRGSRGGSHPTCTACGSGRLLWATGTRHPLPTDVEPGEYLRRDRAGRPVYADERPRAYRDLHATRCADCGHDAVYDARTGEAWDLDETDYGPDGSTALTQGGLP